MSIGSSCQTLLLLVICLITVATHAAESSFDIGATPRTVAIDNHGKQQAPTVYLVGRTDLTSDRTLHTRGATIDGIRVSEKLLTGGIMILRPDGTGVYGYRAGFLGYTEPRQERPEADTFFNKYKWDPLSQVRVRGGGGNYLCVAIDNRSLDAVYELVVPAPMRIRSVQVRFACSQADRAFHPITRLFADSTRKRLLRQVEYEHGNRATLQPVFEQLDTEKVYLQLTSNGKAKSAVLSNVVFWAELDLGGIKLPPLTEGENSWTYTDDTDSSHQAKIIVRWDDGPSIDNPLPLIPDAMANYSNPIDTSPPPAGQIVSLREFFPLGVYGGVIKHMPTLAYLMDALKTKDCNLWYINNLDMGRLEEILDVAERRGIRILPQGSHWSSLYYRYDGTAEQRSEGYKKGLVPAATRIIPAFRDRWGLLGWMLTEEIKSPIVDEVSGYYQLARELDPNHPSMILHNNLASCRKDIELNGCPIVFHDSYPFFLDARHGPSTYATSLRYLKRHLDDYSKVARAHDLPFWMMLQSMGWPMVFKPALPVRIHKALPFRALLSCG